MPLFHLTQLEGGQHLRRTSRLVEDPVCARLLLASQSFFFRLRLILQLPLFFPSERLSPSRVTLVPSGEPAFEYFNLISPQQIAN